MEATLRWLVDAGFTLRQAVRAAATTYLFTIGFVTGFEEGLRLVVAGIEARYKARRRRT